MTNTNRIPHIVIGTNHHNTLGIVKCLGMVGIPVILIIKGEKGFVEKSKYVTECFHIEKVEDCLETLEIISNGMSERLIVLSTSDLFTHILDLNYDKLSPKFQISNCKDKNGGITYFMNKDTQVDIASRIGINVPDTINYNWDSHIPTPKKYPVIIKPLKSIGGGKNIQICNSEDELKLAMSHFDKNYPVQIQEFVKKEYEIVLLGCAANNNIVIPGFIRKHRDDKGGTTFSTVYSVEKLQSEIIEKAKCFIEEIGYTGLFGIEFIYSENEFYFIEANLRCDATTYSMAVSGSNLPNIYSMMLNDNYNHHIDKIETLNSMVEFSDVYFMLKREISLTKWIKDIKSCKVTYFYDKKDMKPFWERLKTFTIFFIKKVLKLTYT